MLTLPLNLLRLFTLASVMLVACNIKKPRDLGSGVFSQQWRQHQKLIKQITHYQVRGTFIFLSGQQKFSAHFRWQKIAPDRYRLLLTNPLGNTELQLDTQGSFIQVIDNKGNIHISNNEQKIISQLTGMEIPLPNLRQWMIGLPGDTIDYQINGQYRLYSLNYRYNSQDWHVTISAYDTKIHPPLPAHLEIKGGGQVIKLRMDNWIVQ